MVNIIASEANGNSRFFFSLWNFNAVLSISIRVDQIAIVKIFPKKKKKGKKQKRVSKDENGNCDN